MKMVKKIIAMVLTFIMVLSMATAAFADVAYVRTDPGVPADGNTGYGFVRNVTRGALLSIVGCVLTTTTDGKRLKGEAEARGTDTMDLIGYDMYFYKYDTSAKSWKILNPGNPAMNSETNTEVCLGYHQYPKSGAGRYRIEVDHYAELGNQRETMHQISTYIDVD